jgi:hypothetical protein
MRRQSRKVERRRGREGQYSPILCAWREALDAKRLLWALFTCARPPPMSAAAAAGGPAALLRGSLEGGWWSNGQVGVDKIGSAGGGRKRWGGARWVRASFSRENFFYFILGANSCLLPSDPNPTSQNRVGEIPNLICNEGHRFKCFSRSIVFAL